MLCFKSFVLIFVVSLAVFDAANADCSNDDLNKIYGCYKSTVFGPLGWPMIPSDFIKRYINATQDVNNIKQICDAKKSLTNCLTDSVVKNCFNAKDFTNVQFVTIPNDAIKMVANYIQLDYVCGSVNKLVMDKAQCALNIPKKCGYDNDIQASCSAYAAYIQCAIKESKDVCGAPASCFAHKYLTLQTCYFQQSCDMCSNIDYNKNPVNTICSDDANYNPNDNNGNNGNNGNGNKGNNVVISLGLLFAAILLSSF